MTAGVGTMPAVSMTMSADDPVAVELLDAIHSGDLDRLRQQLRARPGLANVRIRSEEDCSRTMLHVAADFPGHLPNGAAIVTTLIEAGADVNARFDGEHSETPLHWAASSDDVELLDALIDAGADIDASGAVIAGGTPLDDAVAFAQWRAAHRLVERGATTALWHAAALGLMDRLKGHFAGDELPAHHPWGAASGVEPPDAVTVAFWCACHGGQQAAASYLLDQGADLNWIATWDDHTALDTAIREGHDEVVDWLRAQGARSSAT